MLTVRLLETAGVEVALLTVIEAVPIAVSRLAGTIAVIDGVEPNTANEDVLRAAPFHMTVDVKTYVFVPIVWKKFVPYTVTSDWPEPTMN